MKGIKNYLQKNAIYKNSLFLLISNGYLAASGFVFWILAARTYPTYDIGIATSVLALINLISILALLGFHSGMLRFLPTSESKNEDINSTIILTCITSGVFALIVVI